ncbi:MAG TPA: sulfite oxidase-like oxidoreductase [Stellaceae bacterium]|nr:sulfite oxidase-like oxidoreductase [Stellaceae bacterium]
MNDKPEDRLSQVRPKLVESKERWARDGRLLTGRAAPRGERLPPGQHRVRDWPVLDLGVVPKVELAEWRLTVDGLVESKLDWSWAEFRAQPQFLDVSDIHCVTAWSRFDNQWEGVSAKHILALAKPLPEARFVVFHSFDDYTTNLPLPDFDDDDVLLAHSWQGQLLAREHGGPVRAVVPKLYFWKSAKWIRRIELIAADRRGFWEERGYHDRGDPWSEQRYG